jgi:hypothetical protein
MKLGEVLVAAIAGLPSAAGVGWLGWVVCVAGGQTGWRRWAVSPGIAVNQWAMVTTLLVLLQLA